MLQLLVAEALGLLDRGPLLRVGGEERRLGPQPLELAGDLARALDLVAVDLQRRHGLRRGSRPPAAPPWRSPASGRCACRRCPCARASAARRSPGASRESRRGGRHGTCARPMPTWRRSAIIARCCSRSTSATPRPTSAPSRASDLVEHWRFQTRAGATGDELAERIAGLLALCGHRPRRPRRRLRLLGGAAARHPVRAAVASATSERRLPDDRPRRQDRDADPDRQPARGRRRPPRQRGRRLRPVRRRLRRRRLRHRRSTSTRSPPTASTSAARSAPGSRSRCSALTERAARIPRIDLAEPEAAIGRSTPGGDPVGLRLRLRRPDRRHRRGGSRTSSANADASSPPAASPRPIVPFSETIDEVDDLLTLKGLRLIHETQRLSQPDRSDRPLRDRRRRDRQPGPARAAGRDRQLVRPPAGAPPRRRAGGLGDGLELRPPLPQRAHAARADADPSRRAPGLDPALRPGPRGDALRRRRSPPRPAPT